MALRPQTSAPKSSGYNLSQCEEFARWIEKLRDRSAAAVILRRLDRMKRGNFGDFASVGDGVSEIRIDFGPGYRVYFTERQGALIILLCGGDKDSQSRDIKRAKRLAKEL